MAIEKNMCKHKKHKQQQRMSPKQNHQCLALASRRAQNWWMGIYFHRTAAGGVFGGSSQELFPVSTWWK